MIAFEYTWALLLIPVVALLLWKTRLSRVLSFSSHHAGGKIARGWALLGTIPNYAVVASLLLALLMLANPLGEVEEIYATKLSYRVAVVIDKSGSMAENGKIVIARKATLDFFERRKSDLAAILPFDSEPLFAEGSGFTTDREYIYGMTNAIDATGYSTAIGDAMLGGLWYILRDIYVTKKMKEDGLRMPPYSEIRAIFVADQSPEQDQLAERLARQFGSSDGNFIVLVTDGESNSGVPPEVAISFLGALRIPVYVIGIGGDFKNRPAFADKLEERGGAYFYAAQPEQLAVMYQRIDELRPTTTKSKRIMVQHSYRHELALLIFCLLALAVVARGSYLVIE